MIMFNKIFKICLSILGITALGFLIRQEKRKMKNLRRNLDELNRESNKLML